MWNPAFSLQDALMRHAHAKQGINRVPFMPGVPGISSWDGFNPLAAGNSAAHRPFHVQRFLKQAAAAQQQLQRHVSFMKFIYLFYYAISPYLIKKSSAFEKLMITNKFI